MNISPEALNTKDTIHISNDSQEEGRRGLWSWKGLIQQCRGIPGQRRRRGLIGEWKQKMWYIYTMEFYSAIKNNEFMKFLGKWLNLENIFLHEVTPSQKNTHGMQSLISGY